MRVLMPMTRVWPEATTALCDTGWEWDSIPVGQSDRAYYDLLAVLWGEGQAFCIVEHDIVVHPTALDELNDCTHAWCGFPHEYMGRVTQGMGCVKFGSELMTRHPDAMIRVGVMSDNAHPKRHWCTLDSWLQGVILPCLGEVKHHHEPPVAHLGSGCSHGCPRVAG